MKRKKIMKKNVNIIIFTMIGICMFWILYHQIISNIEEKKYSSPYSFVEVKGKKISYSKIGNGEIKIVLLPGLGTVSPILDFAPLAEELSKSYTVITIEPFGYGFSDETKEPRTIENEVFEIHEALQNIGISDNYLLMAHSISGLDIISYINQYPDEVIGVIGIDCTLPRMVEYFDEDIPAKNFPLLGELCKLGVMRLIEMIHPNALISDNTFGIYSDENLRMQISLASRIASNTTVIHQNNAIADNIDATKDFSFPSHLPILFFTTKDSTEKMDETTKTKASFYNTYITNPSIQKVIVYDAPHYMHWSKSREMTADINAFLTQ